MKGSKAGFFFLLLLTLHLGTAACDDRGNLKRSGTVILQNGKELAFDQLGSYGGFAGDTVLLFTDDSAEIDNSKPNRVEVRIRDVKSLEVGKKITKKRPVPDTNEVWTCEWFEIKLSMVNGETVELRTATSSHSYSLMACGSPLSLSIEKAGVVRNLDIASIKAIRIAGH